ncbi:tyrosine-type recombinase/integrase [Pseudogracilibacillus auburnensis]
MSPHALRHGFTKNLYIKSNLDLALVSKVLGHSDFSVTTR